MDILTHPAGAGVAAVAVLVAGFAFYRLFGRRIIGKKARAPKAVGKANIVVTPDVKGFSDAVEAELARFWAQSLGGPSRVGADAQRLCGAAIDLAGTRHWCDQPADHHGWPHSSVDAQAMWTIPGWWHEGIPENFPMSRQVRYAELVATHGIVAEPLVPDRDTKTVYSCTACNFTGSTRLEHAMHIVARIVTIEADDRRILAAMRGPNQPGGLLPEAGQ